MSDPVCAVRAGFEVSFKNLSIGPMELAFRNCNDLLFCQMWLFFQCGGGDLGSQELVSCFSLTARAEQVKTPLAPDEMGAHR